MSRRENITVALPNEHPAGQEIWQCWLEDRPVAVEAFDAVQLVCVVSWRVEYIPAVRYLAELAPVGQPADGPPILVVTPELLRQALQAV